MNQRGRPDKKNESETYNEYLLRKRKHQQLNKIIIYALFCTFLGVYIGFYLTDLSAPDLKIPELELTQGERE